jgi:hypothetical protein
MMASATTTLEEIAPLSVGPFEMVVTGPRTVRMRGELSMRDPVVEVGPHVRKIHDAAAGGGELVVDLTELKFVNSSGLRIFLDWIAWMSIDPPERRYHLKLRTSRAVMWQAAALGPILMLGGDLVSQEPA